MNRRFRGLIPVIAIFLLSTPEYSDAGKIETWIISGQSNAVGAGKLPGPEPDPRVMMYDVLSRDEIRSTGKWSIAQDPMESMMGSKGVGPWVSAAQEVVKQADASIRLVGSAWFGKPIQFWNPGEHGHVILMQRIRRAAQGAQVFLWYQGESDAAQWMDMEIYLSELKKHVARVRREADRPDMTAVIVQVTGGYHMGLGPICEAQRQFVIQDKNSILVTAVGRSLEDQWHLNRDGYRELGHEIASALLRNVYGQKDTTWPGPVLDRAVIGKDKRTVRAHFAEVATLKGCKPGDFAIMDTQGLVIRQYAVRAVSHQTVIDLHFDSTVMLPAKMIYGAVGYPKATLTDEMGFRAPAVQIDIEGGSPPEDKASAAPNGAGRNR